MKTRVRAVSMAILLALSSACMAYVVPENSVFVARRPPPPRREVVVVAPGPGQVWVAGHWLWRANDFAWQPGVWVRIQPGHRQWVPGQWRHERRGWFWVEGRWR